MAIRENERLRQLVNDRYHGLITEESYRQQRGNLLDNIGTEQPADTDTTETRPNATARSRSPRSTPPEIPRMPEEPSRNGRRWLSAALVVVAAAALGYVGYVNFGDRIESASGSATDDRTIGAAPRNSLIAGFLSRNQWTSDSVNNFLIAWDVLDDDQRNELLGSREYRRLTTQLHQRIREQIALGTGVRSRQTRVLTEFAAAIGAPYRQSNNSEIVEAEVVVEEPAEPGPDMVPDEQEVVEPAQPDPVPPEESIPLPEESPAAAGNFPEPASEIAEQAITASTASEDLPDADDPCPADKARTRRPFCQDVLAVGAEGPMLVVLPAGSFSMGSDRFDSESPRHIVNIDYEFAMSVYEITADEYGTYCESAGRSCTLRQREGDTPVVSVSWEDAVDYVAWLSEQTGFRYRLPTESEWEYAARAGTETPYFFGEEITPSSAHSSVNGDVEVPLAVSDRGVNRNPFRLYHMSGNVREWVQDSWLDNYTNAPTDGSAAADESHSRKVVRGGSFRDDGSRLRSAAREPLESNHRDSVTGLRIVREITE